MWEKSVRTVKIMYFKEMDILKVLTIKQPWATLIMQGDKRFEFRSWQTKYIEEIY